MNHEEDVTVPRSPRVLTWFPHARTPTHTDTHSRTHTHSGVEHHYRPLPIDGEYYAAKLISLRPRPRRRGATREKKKDRKTESSTTLFQSAYLS